MYVATVLEKFATFLGPPHEVRKSPLPSDAMDLNARVEPELSVANQTHADNFPYRSLLGVLLYLSMNTRPVIASQSAEALAENAVYYKPSKHIEIKYQWVREHVDPKEEFMTVRLIYGAGDREVFTRSHSIR